MYDSSQSLKTTVLLGLGVSEETQSTKRRA
jgi:hypothetical protein